MFSNLKQGSQIWILHSGTATPFIEVGIVETINNVMPMMFYPNMPAYPMDMTVKVGERSIPFQRLPTNAETATVTDQTGESVVIACSKDGVTNEIDAMIQRSVEIINSVDYHKNRLQVLADLKKQIHPELAEKEAQAQEISNLREELKQLREIIAKQGETSS